jgi:carboxymethylenebutenolidase
MGQTIEIQTEGGEFSAYVTGPIRASAPAVVVLHEIFGLNEDIRQTCIELADKGFIAIAPELFWRQERGVDLNAWSDTEWKKGLALYSTPTIVRSVCVILSRPCALPSI